MKYYIKEPVVPMKKNPQKNAEVVSQAYFSEEIHVIETLPEWTKISTSVDQYLGWVPTHCLQLKSYPFPSSAIVATVERCAAHVYTIEDTIYGPLVTLPFESRLEVSSPPQDPNSRWIPIVLVDGRSGFIQRGDVSLYKIKITRAQLIEFSKRFLDLPYTWGGRSSFGYDCSGFVQMLYRQMGVFIPRDAIDQMHWKGFSSVSMTEAKIGDLIFWGHHAKAIVHVGMYLGQNQFIHATVAENAPYLRISPLSSYWNENGHFSYRAVRTLLL